ASRSPWGSRRLRPLSTGLPPRRFHSVTARRNRPSVDALPLRLTTYVVRLVPRATRGNKEEAARDRTSTRTRCPPRLAVRRPGTDRRGLQRDGGLAQPDQSTACDAGHDRFGERT